MPLGARVLLKVPSCAMRIQRGDDVLGEVVIFLSRAEARELRDAAEDVLEHFEEDGYHAHISSADYQVEVTLAPERE